MAIPKRIEFTHEYVFPQGAFLVSEVRPVNDFDRSTRENKVQELDKDNGLPVWAIDVVDADPDAGRKSKTVTVKIPAKVQPVPPDGDGKSPFTPVYFEGLTALPWVETNGDFSSINWSIKATGMRAVGKPATPSSANEQMKGAA